MSYFYTDWCFFGAPVPIDAESVLGSLYPVVVFETAVLHDGSVSGKDLFAVERPSAPGANQVYLHPFWDGGPTTTHCKIERTCLH